MLDIKDNYREKYVKKNTTEAQKEEAIKCRACNTAPETQKHVLEECQAIHTSPENIVSQEEIFEDSPDELKVAANKVRTIMEKLKTTPEKLPQQNPIIPPQNPSPTNTTHPQPTRTTRTAHPQMEPPCEQGQCTDR